MNRILVFSLLIISFAACTTEQTTDASNTDRVSFFDLELYFQDEAARLKTNVGQLEKEMIVDGVAEKQLLTDVNFEEELALFAKLNINRPIWLDKYEVDSIFGSSNQLEAVEYSTTDEKLKTNKLIVDYNAQGAVKGIMIHNSSSTLIMESKQLLNYNPDSGYQIQTYQDPLFFDEKEIVLNGSWGE